MIPAAVPAASGGGHGPEARRFAAGRSAPTVAEGWPTSGTKVRWRGAEWRVLEQRLALEWQVVEPAGHPDVGRHRVERRADRWGVGTGTWPSVTAGQRSDRTTVVATVWRGRRSLIRKPPAASTLPGARRQPAGSVPGVADLRHVPQLLHDARQVPSALRHWLRAGPCRDLDPVDVR
jgi:hypothetical protein